MGGELRAEIVWLMLFRPIKFQMPSLSRWATQSDFFHKDKKNVQLDYVQIWRDGWLNNEGEKNMNFLNKPEMWVKHRRGAGVWGEEGIVKLKWNDDKYRLVSYDSKNIQSLLQNTFQKIYTVYRNKSKVYPNSHSFAV